MGCGHRGGPQRPEDPVGKCFPWGKERTGNLAPPSRRVSGYGREQRPDLRQNPSTSRLSRLLQALAPSKLVRERAKRSSKLWRGYGISLDRKPTLRRERGSNEVKDEKSVEIGGFQNQEI